MEETYGFVLEFDELDDFLKEAKIDEYIRYNLEDFRALLAEEHELSAVAAEALPLDDIVNSKEARKEAYIQIENHFPIYF